MMDKTICLFSQVWPLNVWAKVGTMVQWAHLKLIHNYYDERDKGTCKIHGLLWSCRISDFASIKNQIKLFYHNNNIMHMYFVLLLLLIC